MGWLKIGTEAEDIEQCAFDRGPLCHHQDTSPSSIKMMANKWCELLLSFKSVTAFSLFWTSESKRFPWSAPGPGRHGSKWGEAKPQSEPSFRRTCRIVKGFADQSRCSWHCQLSLSNLCFLQQILYKTVLGGFSPYSPLPSPPTTPPSPVPHTRCIV